jgi:hypothetical protein
LKNGHEERFAGEEAFAGAEEAAHEAAGLLGAVAEDRLHGDAVIHEHHAAGFGDDGFAGIEFDFDELHVVAVDLVVDFVHGIHGRNRSLVGIIEE